MNNTCAFEVFPLGTFEPILSSKENNCSSLIENNLHQHICTFQCGPSTPTNRNIHKGQSTIPDTLFSAVLPPEISQLVSNELEKHLSIKMPYFMYPSFILDGGNALPKQMSEKKVEEVQREVEPQVIERPLPKKRRRAPRGASEKTITHKWCYSTRRIWTYEQTQEFLEKVAIERRKAAERAEKDAEKNVRQGKINQKTLIKAVDLRKIGLTLNPPRSYDTCFNKLKRVTWSESENEALKEAVTNRGDTLLKTVFKEFSKQVLKIHRPVDCLFQARALNLITQNEYDEEGN